ncbi:unnamed protein product, partial [Meganyctiphanes norvegica]
MNVDKEQPDDLPLGEENNPPLPEQENEQGNNSSLEDTSDVEGNCETTSQCSDDGIEILSSIDTDAEIQKSDSDIKLVNQDLNQPVSSSEVPRSRSEGRGTFGESLSRAFKKVFHRSRSPSPKGAKREGSLKRKSSSRQLSGSSEEDTLKDLIINDDSLQESELEFPDNSSLMHQSATSDCLNLDVTDEVSNASNSLMPKSETFSALSDKTRKKKDCLLEEGNDEDNHHPSIYLSSEKDNSKKGDKHISDPTMLAKPYADPEFHSDMSDISDDEGSIPEPHGYNNSLHPECEEAHAHESVHGEEPSSPSSENKNLIDDSEETKSGRASPGLQRLRELGEKVKEMGAREMGARGGEAEEDGKSLQKVKPQTSSFRMGKIAQ